LPAASNAKYYQKKSSAIYNVKNRTLIIILITIRYRKKDFKIIKCQLKLNGTRGV